MKILLIGSDYEENLSIGYLASSLEKAGYESDFIPFNQSGDKDTVLQKAGGYPIIGLSMVYQQRAKDYLDLASAIKLMHPKIQVIAGGHFASLRAEEILSRHSSIDVIVMGEGEVTLVNLMDYYSGKKHDPASIKGIAYNASGRVIINEPQERINDLDILPNPRRYGKLYQVAGIPTAYLFGSRGCINRCEYCSIMAMHELSPGKLFRERSIENIMGEMKPLYEEGIRQFVFHDDNFLTRSQKHNHERVDELSKALNENGIQDISLIIKCCPDEVDREIFTKLRQIGLTRVFMGIESSNENILRSFNRKQSMESVYEALSICKELDVSVQFNIMFFTPGTTLSTLENDIRFMEKHLDYPFNLCRLELYAGIPLEKKMLASGKASGNFLGYVYQQEDPLIQKMSNDFVSIFYDRFWSDTALIPRMITMEMHRKLILRFFNTPAIRKLADKMMHLIRKVNENSLYYLIELVRIHQLDESRKEKELNTMKQQHQIDLKKYTTQSCKITLNLKEKLTGLLQYSGKRHYGFSIIKKINPIAAALLAALTVSCTEWYYYGPHMSEPAPSPFQLIDQDGDELHDPYETGTFGTDPSKIDTDGDTIDDKDEDHDLDGKTNLEEQQERIRKY